MSRFDSYRGVRPFERHSLVLLVAGTVYIMIGGSMASNPPTTGSIEALHYALRVTEYDNWGLVFCFAGFLSIVSSRWPPVSETWGYTCMTGLSTAWSLFYAAGVLFHNAPTIFLVATLQWGLVAFLWWAISGLINPKIKADQLDDLEFISEGEIRLDREG